MAEIKGNTVAVVDSTDVAGQLEHVFMDATERLSAIVKAIASIAGNRGQIATLARQGGEIADELHNDLDVLREQLTATRTRPALAAA